LEACKAPISASQGHSASHLLPLSPCSLRHWACRARPVPTCWDHLHRQYGSVHRRTVNGLQEQATRPRTIPCGGLFQAKTVGRSGRSCTPIVRGGLTADGSFRDAASRLPPQTPFSTRQTLTGRHGARAWGISWRGPGRPTLPCWLLTSLRHAALHTALHCTTHTQTPEPPRSPAAYLRQDGDAICKKYGPRLSGTHSMNSRQSPSQFESTSDLMTCGRPFLRHSSTVPDSLIKTNCPFCNTRMVRPPPPEDTRSSSGGAMTLTVCTSGHPPALSTSPRHTAHEPPHRPPNGKDNHTGTWGPGYSFLARRTGQIIRPAS
jgi:hypothetical protein